MANEKGRTTLGLIVSNRGFFPNHLCRSGRETMLSVLDEAGVDPVALTPEDTTFGSIESLSDARKCAELFKEHREEIDGVLVTLPNFGDERAVANALRWADLEVPVLVHAFPDEVGNMTISDRRDAFCGKMSACNNLKQYGIPFSLTDLHTVDPESDAFQKDLERFLGVCRVVGGLRNARIGAIGARPAAFNTVRYSEKLFERAGISVETVDLSDLLGRVERLEEDDPRIEEKKEEITGYVVTKGVPSEPMDKMAKLGVVIEEWMAENELVASAIQCWTAMEEFYGIVPCTLMSMMSDSLVPSACETDVAGVIGMYAMTLASGTPSALVDWNNNYGEDPNKAVIFHCSNLPKHFFEEKPDMDYQEIIAGDVGEENTYGTVVGRLKSGPLTYCRVSTNDFEGEISVYLGEGRLTNDTVNTFGGYGVIEIPEFQRLLQIICEEGFEHHVAVNLTQTADAVEEALGKYLQWDVYRHAG